MAIGIFRILHRLFLILGAALIIFNLCGLALYDNPWPQPESGRRGPDYQPYSSEMKKFMEKGADEKPLDYAQRMNAFVYNHTVHYFPEEKNPGNLDITAAPFLWNWAIWLRAFWAFLAHEDFVVEFCDADKGLERGYGLCSQRALILQDILRKHGLKAKATKLYGHVVCMTQIGGEEILLDPDHGFSIPHGLDYLHAHPETINAYSPSPEIASMYTPILQNARWPERGDAEYGCRDDSWLFKMTLIQWLAPFLLLFCSLYFKWIAQRPN